MASNVNIVKGKWTDFLKSSTFWWVIIFILLAGFYMWSTNPNIPIVDYTGFDEDGNPEVWMQRQNS